MPPVAFVQPAASTARRDEAEDACNSGFRSCRRACFGEDRDHGQGQEGGNVGISGCIAIGAGGAIGCWLRWGPGVLLNPAFPTMPMGTLAAKLRGGLLIGCAMGLFEHFQPLPSALRLAVFTGFPVASAHFRRSRLRRPCCCCATDFSGSAGMSHARGRLPGHDTPRYFSGARFAAARMSAAGQISKRRGSCCNRILAVMSLHASTALRIGMAAGRVREPATGDGSVFPATAACCRRDNPCDEVLFAPDDASSVKVKVLSGEIALSCCMKYGLPELTSRTHARMHIARSLAHFDRSGME